MKKSGGHAVKKEISNQRTEKTNTERRRKMTTTKVKTEMTNILTQKIEDPGISC